MIDVFLSYDVEDPIHPVADDALLRLCRLMSEVGVPGNLFVVGEKARVLRERSRRDVLAAMAEHEVCYHGNYWFEFPECAMVYGERLGWDEAVDYATRIELDGLHDVAEITGAWPVAWVQHQNNCNAMMPHIMRRLGVKVWNGGFAGGPLTGWFEDSCVVTRSAHTMSLQGQWTAGDQDPLNPVSPPRAMDPEAEFDAFCRRFDEIAEKHGVVVPLGHPTCWAISEWWGWYEWGQLTHQPAPYRYPRGRVFRQIPPRCEADVESHFAFTEQVFRWLAGRRDVRCTTYGEYSARHAEPGLQWLTLDQVDQLAAALADGPTHTKLGTTTLSAADALGVFAHLFSVIARQGSVPTEVALQRLLGPVEEPHPAQPTKAVRASLFALAGELYDHCVTHRRIPGMLRARTDFGPASALLCLAGAWREFRRSGAWPEMVEVEPQDDLPAAASLDFFRHPVASSSHAPAGYQTTIMAERARWQSWSYRDFADA